MNHTETGKNNSMGSGATKHDGGALGKIKVFLNLRNKRIDGNKPIISTLVSDDHCAVRLTAPDLCDVVCEIDTLRELHRVTCQSNDRHRETIATQSAEIERLRAVIHKFLTDHVDGCDFDDTDYGRGVEGSGIVDEMREALKGGA